MDSNIEIQARKTRDIEELTNELAHSSLTSSNHAIEEVKDCIHDCGSLLKSAMPPSNDESLDALRDSFRTIIEKCESEKTDYNKSIDSLAAIENYDVNRTITADNKTENIKLKKKLIEDRTNLKQTHDNLRKIIGDAKLSLHQIESGYNNYSQMSMMLTSCISSIINTNQAYQQMQLGQAFRLAPQYKLSSQAIADNKNELNNLISKYHREIENYHYFKDSIQKKIAELSKTVTANNPKFLLQEKRLKQESIVRDNLKAKLTTLGGVLSQFQIFTKSSLPYLKNAEHCPTCGHKWESSTALEKAINTTCTTDKSHLTVKINYLNNQINSKNNLITEIENFITIANSQREELARLKDEAYSRERRWSEYIASVKKATPNFVDGDLFENLNSAIKHYTIANELSIIWHNNAFIQQAIGNNNIHEFTMLNLKLALESALTDGHAQFELEFGNAKKSLNLSTAELETIEMKLAQISADIERIDKIVKQANREKINIEEAWRILAPGKEFTADNLKNVWDEQRENENRLNALSEEIKRANFIFDTIPKFVKLEELKNEISAAKNKETKIENTLRSAKSIIRFHEDLFNNKMLSQIISLENIINVLFLRMQVNFVYNGIKFDRDGQQPIIRKICACSGHTEVDPETYFSRGQRQDLALAIFLARAIAIGGTFFLDEPFAHLDDLNRVAMIDILRVLTIQHKDKINLVVTTASDQLVDLITSKFTNVPHQKNCASPLTVYQLSGNPRIGTEAEKFCYGLPV